MGYRGKVDEQSQARALRAQAWTLAEIATELGVSRSSVSLWVRDVPFDESVRAARARAKRGVAARRREPNALARRKQDEITRLLAEGRRTIGDLSDRDLLIAGTALYAGEGGKTDGVVNFANSDPRMVALFCRWLRHTSDVDESRLRLYLYLHQGLDVDAARAFWSGVTAIPPAQFRRPYRAAPDPGIRRAKHPMGCARVSYACGRTHRAIMGLIGGLLS
ncbi:MAG TPA: hypothetical protein VFZ77_22005 [Acidimicrobiales bacterium]